MKRMAKLMGIIALAAIIGLSTTGCPDGGSTGGDPALTGNVIITGFIKVDVAVTVNTNDLGGTGTINCQWQQGDTENGTFTDIPGGEGDSYTPTSAVEGKYIRAAVTRTGYTGTKYSNALKVNAANATPPTISSVTVSSNTGEDRVAKGGTLQLAATVSASPSGADNEKVIWSVTGGTGTSISNSGLLSVGANESASTLTVTATSTIDDTKKGTLTITVTAPAAPPVTMTITGITGMNGQQAQLYIVTGTMDQNGVVAGGFGPVINGTLTIPLRDVYSGEAWTGRGPYWISMMIGSQFNMYVYANGTSLPNMANAPTYNIQNANTSIAFNRFAKIEIGAGGYQLTITGIPATIEGFNLNGGFVEVRVIDYVYDDEYGYWNDERVASGGGILNGSQITISLAGEDGFTGWRPTGTQQYWLELRYYKEMNGGYLYADYTYTNGQNIDFENRWDFDWNWEDVPRYTFTGTGSSVALNRFQEIYSGYDAPPEFPGVPASSTQLNANAWATGNIDGYDSEDWYRFTVSAGTTYYFWVDDKYGGGSHKDVDVYLTAWYANGDIAFEIDDAWPGIFTAATGGTVYIRVETYDWDGGAYAIAYNTGGIEPK